ncbi:MAG TPA: glycine-rich domain-containing protein-like [Coleofasciculaceae cyanobacterium]
MIVINQASPSFAVFLQKARQLDLSPIAYQLMQSEAGPRWTRAKTVKAIAQYLAFLYLIDRYSHLSLVPSLEIDQVWHYHILDTRKYAEDCQLLFDCMIHHFPYLGLRGVQDRRSQSKAYAITQILFTKHFDGNSIGQNSLPGDCEPIRLRATSDNRDYFDALHLQARPQVALDIQEVLVNMPVSSVS